MERLEEELNRERDAQAERATKPEATDEIDSDMGVLERREDVEKMWGRGTEGLVELGKIPVVLAKLERAGKAAEVVENM